MSHLKALYTRRNFLFGSSLFALGAAAAGCHSSTDHQRQSGPINPDPAINTDQASWWHKGGYIVHETVDTRRISEGIIRAYVDGSWREFKVVELPERFVNWSMKTRLARLGRMLQFGGMDPRDLAGSHNACVATYGGSSRDSVVSINTAYKGMGFVICADKLTETTQKIREAQRQIEWDAQGDHMRAMQAKVEFLAKFYREPSFLDLTKQVSLELFTSSDFQTHTFLNMMANPIASFSFLAFPTFEIRAIPQLLHPQNPGLSKRERDLIAYTNVIHDFIHSGAGERITCVYHVLELFDDTPNDSSKGKRII